MAAPHAPCHPVWALGAQLAACSSMPQAGRCWRLERADALAAATWAAFACHWAGSLRLALEAQPGPISSPAPPWLERWPLPSSCLQSLGVELARSTLVPITTQQQAGLAVAGGLLAKYSCLQPRRQLELLALPVQPAAGASEAARVWLPAAACGSCT